MRERQEITEMFAQADQYILKNPEILDKSMDDIFEDLDDGSPEMIHTRWGVMVRAKMAELKDYDEASVIRFLSTIEEKNLMCEYIGYVLQEEKSVCLLKLVVASRGLGVELDFLPFIASNVEYEKDIEIDDVPIIIDVLEKNKESNYFQSVLSAIGQLIVKKQKEDAILEKYLKEPTERMKVLIYFVGVEMCKERSDRSEKTIEELLKQENRLCNISAIDIWGRCVLSELNCVDKYLDAMLSLYDQEKEYRLSLISYMVEYLEGMPEGRHREDVFLRLFNISDTEEKILLIRTMEYQKSLCEESKRIINQMLKVSFEKNAIILGCLDLYLEDMVVQDVEKALKCLKQIYQVNNYNLNDDFFGVLPYVSKALAENQIIVCKTVVESILGGELFEFTFAIRLYEKILSIEGYTTYLKECGLSESDMLFVLKGILLFTVEPKKLCNMIYIGLQYIEETRAYMDFCIEMIYGNYPGTFIEVTNRYITAENEKQRTFAENIICFDKEQSMKIEESYKNEELWPSDTRRKAYYREKREQEKKINQEAQEMSILSQFCTNRKMKYGKRHAFVQVVKKGKFVYQVQDYMTHSVEFELPKVLVSDPIEFHNLRNQYLESRCINETDC